MVIIFSVIGFILFSFLLIFSKNFHQTSAFGLVLVYLTITTGSLYIMSQPNTVNTTITNQTGNDYTPTDAAPVVKLFAFVLNIFSITDESSIVGSCDHIHLKKETNITLSNGSVSIFAKIDNKKSATKRYIMDMVNYKGDSFLEIFVLEEKFLQIEMTGINNQKIALNSYIDNIIDDFIFITVTWNNKEIKLYINGKLKSTAKLDNIDFNFPIKDWYLGSSNKKRFCLFGTLDELTIRKDTMKEYDIEVFWNNSQNLNMLLGQEEIVESNKVFNRKRDIYNVPNVDMALSINGSSGWQGNIIWINPSQCNGTISIYYEANNPLNFQIRCKEAS